MYTLYIMIKVYATLNQNYTHCNFIQPLYLLESSVDGSDPLLHVSTFDRTHKTL